MFLNDLFESGEYPTYYFAYGMLTDPEIMGDTELVGVGQLPNFKFEMMSYANVVPATGKKVYGCLWSIDRQLLSRLDRIEGYPYLYDRRTYPVYVDGEKYAAEVYVMTPETRMQLVKTEPTQSYISKIVRGYQHAGVPLEQLKQSLKK